MHMQANMRPKMYIDSIMRLIILCNGILSPNCSQLLQKKLFLNPTKMNCHFDPSFSKLSNEFLSVPQLADFSFTKHSKISQNISKLKMLQSLP